jgi:DMSO/TMAO reductase YedYZ heme-binding membrane subunit
VASTRSRPRGREHARPSAGGAAAEHATKIYTVAIIGIIVIVAFLALTSVGHVVDAATQHFMLFYAGVFALIVLCGSVVLGLVATDRMFLHPGRRVFIQSAHRAASFGAVTFLIIHIITEILAQRVHVLDAVVPFLSPFRTFYIGLGTIASDLIILLVITGILRGRFNAGGKAWRWRAIHYTAYLSFVFGVWHGLLGGRPGKAYVDWGYGLLIAFVLLGLAVRVLSNSLRPKESLSAPPVDQSASSASAPLRAAAMLAQYGAIRSGRNAILGASTGSQSVLSAPLSAPVLTALPASGATSDPGQPYYEPGYEGPPRYLGAPRATETGPVPRAATGPVPRAATGPMPRAATGPMPRAATGPMPRSATGPLPRAATGPQPRPTGPQARPTGPLPRATGPLPAATGPLPPVTGPLPRANPNPMPRPGTGPVPRSATGPLPRGGTGSFPVSPPRPQSPPSRPGTGPVPRSATGPLPQSGGGRQADWDTGPRPRPGARPGQSGSAPRGGTGPQSRPATGPMASGTGPRPATGPLPQAGGPVPPSGYRGYDSGYDGGHRASYDGGYDASYGGGYEASYEASYDGGQTDPQGWPTTGRDGSWYPEEPQWDGGFPETDPNLRYREPGPGMPGYRGSREHRYGGDRYR